MTFNNIVIYDLLDTCVRQDIIMHKGYIETHYHNISKYAYCPVCQNNFHTSNRIRSKKKYFITVANALSCSER